MYNGRTELSTVDPVVFRQTVGEPIVRRADGTWDSPAWDAARTGAGGHGAPSEYGHGRAGGGKKDGPYGL
jgi:hypothetical protein